MLVIAALLIVCATAVLITIGWAGIKAADPEDVPQIVSSVCQALGFLRRGPRQ